MAWLVCAPAALAAIASPVLIAPAVAGAAQCGPGTFYDAPSDTCLVAVVEPAAAPLPPPAPPPPAPLPPPAPPPPTPYVTASICAPIPIFNLCVGI